MATSRITSKYLIALLALSCLVSCHKANDPNATSSTAQTYVEEVINSMQKYSIYRKKIDWTNFKQQVTVKANGAQTIADTYPAIQLALTLLRDNHSTYTGSNGAVLKGTSSVNCTDETPTTVSSTTKIGYVKITSFTGPEAEGAAFAQSIQNTIKAADSDSIRGWIVDLRGNLGGNMWPMLAGIGPILGEGIVGFFIDPDGNKTPWSYKNGSALLDQNTLAKVENPYTVRKLNPKVAILTDRSTASSGEAIAIAFIGRSNTRSFGNGSCGLSTSNAGIKLSDGALLNLTQAAMADRNQNPYGTAVQPDENLLSTVVVARATAWLLQ